MAARFFVLFVASWALSEGAAVVNEESPASPGALYALQKHASDIHKTVSDQISTIAGSQNTQELSKALKQGSDSIIEQLTEFTRSLQAALNDANGKMKEVLEQTRQKLQRTAEELRKTHPDVEKQATQLRDKLQTAVQNTVQETQKLAKEVTAKMEQTNQKLTPKIKAAYDDFLKQAQEVQKKPQAVGKQ